MIIWLNGTFGCGKTSTAAELHALVPSSRLFDPETVMIRAADLVVDTTGRTPFEIAVQIAGALPGLMGTGSP